ncbi:PDLI4 protein, partial [Crypturellus soui]|nr:PDLI4 protein [Crypturellus soui]
ASGLQLLPECTRCGNGIVGTIVKARDKLYHPECFMCDDCGLNLKQRGYFFIEEQLYCEAHAKERVKPPEGYDVVAVYPNAKVELV